MVWLEGQDRASQARLGQQAHVLVASSILAESTHEGFLLRRPAPGGVDPAWADAGQKKTMKTNRFSTFLVRPQLA